MMCGMVKHAGPSLCVALGECEFECASRITKATCMVCGTGQRRMLVGERGEVARVAHEKLRRVAEVHTSDALMHFEGLGPFPELTEVRRRYLRVPDFRLVVATVMCVSLIHFRVQGASIGGVHGSRHCTTWQHRKSHV